MKDVIYRLFLSLSLTVGCGRRVIGNRTLIHVKVFEDTVELCLVVVLLADEIIVIAEPGRLLQIPLLLAHVILLLFLIGCAWPGTFLMPPHRHNHYRYDDCQKGGSQSHIQPETSSRLCRGRAIFLSDVSPDLLFF